MTQHALHGVQPPWLARSKDLSPIEHVWDMMKQELTLSPEPAKLRQRVQDGLDNLLQNNIRHLYNHLHVRIQACIATIVYFYSHGR